MTDSAKTISRGLPLALASLTLLALLGGCASTGGKGEHKSLPWKHKGGNADAQGLPPAGSGRGGYYQNDGPGANPPPGLLDVPDAVVKFEPYAKYANKPYVVFGTTYTPLLGEEPYNQRGVASWYGVKFHGQRTSSGEPYDMYKMTAAHPTLPIPSYVRVTSLDSGRSVVVRINDRGPFHAERLIDVSYTAALKLGLLGKGSHQVTVERLFPDDATRLATARRAPAAELQAPPPAIAALMLEDRVDMDSAALARPRVQTAAQSPTAVQAQPAASGFYLQLGAFGRDGKAEEMSEQLRQAGVSQALEVVRSGSVNRLMAGPYATRAMAQDAARELPSSLGLKPIVIKR